MIYYFMFFIELKHQPKSNSYLVWDKSKDLHIVYTSRIHYLQSDFDTCLIQNHFYQINMTWHATMMTWLMLKCDIDNYI